MNKIFVLSTSLVAYGLLFAPAAQAEEYNDEEGRDAYLEAHASYEERRHDAQGQHDEE